jgi:hypothetical protein
MLEQAVEFVEKYHDELGVIHHSHTDDITAAALFIRMMERKWKAPKAVIQSHPNIPLVTAELAEKIESKNLQSLVFLDMPLDQDLTHLLPIAKRHKVLVIDDHPIITDLNRYGIVHVSPYLLDVGERNKRYPTSKLTFDICSRITDVDDLSWLAAVGVLGDTSEKYWPELFERVYDRYPKLRYDKDLAGTSLVLKRIVQMMYGAQTFGYRGIATALEACLQSTDPFQISERQIPQAKELMQMKERTEEMVRKIIKQEKMVRRFDAGLVLCQIGHPYSSYNIEAAVAGRLYGRDPYSCVIVSREEGDLTFLEYRTNGIINCRDWAENSIAGLKNATGGGHDYVAGGHIKTKDFSRLVSQTLDYLRNENR